MKERQRWQAEEDAVLHEYVKQYGPRDWHLVSQRMGTLLDRDAKSCVERWKNYLKPGIKKGPLSDEEQQLVISLQAKYGNKWKKIAAEVPGRTAKRLGKWWEVFKDKQQKEKEKERPRFGGAGSADGASNYSEILATFADKYGQRQLGSTVLPTPPFPMPPLLVPPVIAPLGLVGTPIPGRSAVPSPAGILTPKLPPFDSHSSLPLATLAVPVSVMTTAIGSWLSSAINVSQLGNPISTAVGGTAGLGGSDAKIITMEMPSSRGSEAHTATTMATSTMQGPTPGKKKPASEVAAVSAVSQPAASAGSSSLPPWMSIVPSNTSHMPVLGSDDQLPAHASIAVSDTGTPTSLARGVSAPDPSPSVSLSLSTSMVAPSVPPSDSAFVLAHRAWLQESLSRREASSSSRAVIPDAIVNTQAAWCPINPQSMEKILTGPNLVLSRSMLTADPASSCKSWSRFLECCKELEEGRQIWFAQRKESSWRLKRLEAQLESEKMQRRKQKMEEVEASIVGIRDDERKFLEGLEADYKEKISSLHREEEQKDAKMVEIWTAKHMQLSQFVEQMLHQPPPPTPPQSHPGTGPSEKS